MTLTSFTRKLNAIRAENGQKPLTRAGVQYRIEQLIERGTLIESDVRTKREAGTYEWNLPDSLLIIVANFEPKLHRERQGIGRPKRKMNHRILEFICDEAGSAIMREPHQITANGQTYEFATDGIRLLAFPVEQSDLPEIPATIPNVKSVKQRIAAWLTAPATHRTGAAAFANFLNLDEYVVVDKFADPRYVKINGFPFDANLMVRTLVLLDLSHLAGELPIRIETEHIYSSDKGDGAALILHGGKWTLAVMGLSVKRTANDDFDGEWELEAI